MKGSSPLKWLIVTLGLLLPLIVHARLGETREECEKRYGKPLNIREDESVEFQKGVFGVRVYFDRSNRVERIEYRGDEMDPYVAHCLWEANIAEEWVEMGTGEDGIARLYHANLRKLTAVETAERVGTNFTGVLMIYPDDWDRRQAARERRQIEEKKRNKLKDF